MITVWKVAMLVAFAAALVFLILGIVSVGRRNAQRRNLVERMESERRGFINNQQGR